MTDTCSNGPTPPPGEAPGPRGASQAPHVASVVAGARPAPDPCPAPGGTYLDRTVRLPLVAVDEATWRHLRRLAYVSAAWCNAQLSLSYARTRGLVPVADAPSAYQEARDVLAGAVRDALGREVVGLWRRLGRRILRGEQTLARFSVDRALVVRDRGIRLTREGGGHWLHLRLTPKAAGPVTRLAVWPAALRRDPYLARLVERLWAGEWPVTKATVQFRRPGRAVFVRLAYRKPNARHDAVGAASATLTWTAAPEGSADGGALWLRANGRAMSLNDAAHRLARMKTHFAGIHARLRRDLGKRGRRQAHRRALLAAGNFETWALGPLHELSRHVVTWCQREGVGTLTVRGLNDGRLPWHRLVEMLTYKGAEVGIAVSQIDDDSSQTPALRTLETDTKTQLEAAPQRSRRL